MPLRVVVLISGSGSNLQAIIDKKRGDDKKNADEVAIDIVAVISNRPNVLGLDRAKKAGIPTQVLDHTEFSSREVFDEALMACIDNYKPDLVVLAGFMRILTPHFTEHYLGRMLNIHPSLLPKFQGLHTHQRAIDAGETHHGVTVHFVTAELDGGPAVIQARVPVLPNDTADTLAKRVQRQEHLIYPLAIQWFADGHLSMQNNRAQLKGELLPNTGYPIDAPQP
jgi:phosphoribosylglycinamide formyltransferase 1